MEWGKAKNILIALLAAVNAVLLVLNIAYDWERHYLPDSYIEQAVDVLAARGIELDEDVIPQRISSQGALRVSARTDGLKALGRTLLGNTATETAEGAGLVLTTGDAVFTVYDFATLSFEGDAGLGKAASVNGAAKAFLAAMGLTDVDYSLSAEGDTVTVVCRLKGMEVDLVTLVLTVENGEVVRAAGRFLTGAEPATGAEPQDAVGCLLTLADMEEVDLEQLVTMEAVYAVDARQSMPEVTQVVPAFRLTMEDGSRIYYDRVQKRLLLPMFGEGTVWTVGGTADLTPVA